MNEFQRNMFLKETFGNKNIDKARSFFQPGAIEQFKQYQKQAEATGLAEEMAAKNTATLAVAMERVKGAFALAFQESSRAGTGMNMLKNALVFVYTHMNGILTTIGYLIAAFVAWKAIMLAWEIGTKLVYAYRAATLLAAEAQLLWNTYMGTYTGLQAASTIATTTGTSSIGYYTVAVNGANLSTKALLATCTTFLGVAGAVAVALYGLNKLEDWGSQKLAEYAESKFFKDAPPLLINTAHGVEALNEATKKYQFTTYKPEVPISGAPFLSDKEIQQVEKTGQYQPVNSKLAQQTALTKSITTTQKQNVTVTLPNLPHGANVTTDNDLIKIVTGSTLGNFQ